MTKPLILVSNDDGVNAEGIRSLAEALRPLGRVVVVAPSTDQSAVSHAMTLRRPLRLTEVDHDVYAVDGTPTDAVYMAAHHILKGQTIDLVVSGINHGANLGHDILYSGTVSAAMEGLFLGIQSVAFSLVSTHHHDFSVASEFARNLCQSLLKNPLPKGVLLNVNVPKRCIQSGFAVTRMGSHQYDHHVDMRLDLDGRPYYWIGGVWQKFEQLAGTDCNAIGEGQISVTPIEPDLTSERSLSWLSTLQQGFLS